MKIPKKITPDHLKHTIVEVIFIPQIFPELMLGVFYTKFKEQFDFFVPQHPTQRELNKTEDGKNLILHSSIEGYFVDKKESVKVTVRSNSIVFNSYKAYIGWDNFYPIISEVVSVMIENKMIRNITQVGVRYVSGFGNTSISKILDINLRGHLFDKMIDTLQIKNSYTEDNCLINVILVDKKVENKQNTSLVDIDVIQRKEASELSVIMDLVSYGHQKQKSTFFSIIDSDFLTTLNPEY